MVVGDEPCPKCRERGRDKTGNHLIVFDDGNKYCNRCKYFVKSDGQERGGEVEEDMDIKTVKDVQQLPCFGIPHRGISQEACEHFGVRTEFNDKGEPVAWYYPHTNDEGDVVGYKRKTKDKRTFSIGSTREGQLFGSNAAPRVGKVCVVTEGEEDTLAVWDSLKQGSSLEDWNPAVVSLAHGAKGAAGDIGRQLDWLNAYDRVVLCFDQDDAGREAVDAVCPLLPAKVRIAKLPLKDANDMVLAGRTADLKWAVLTNARPYQPDGIINGADTWDRFKKSQQLECHPYPEDWEELNRKTYGFRRGQVITLTGGTGLGKTQVAREIKKHVHATTDWKLADISLEEDVGESVSGLVALDLEQRIHLPDVDVDEEAERKAWEDLFADGRWSFYDHFGGMDDENLFNKLRYFAATGHRAIFIDHLSIIVSEFAAEGGERERIDTVMTKLAKLAKEFEVAIFVIVHLRKEGSGRSFEQGAVPSLDDLRGSGSLKQLSWDVLAISRNQQHEDIYCRNISKITVLKCRFTGRTGEADHLFFDDSTGRMKKVVKPANYDDKQERDW